MRDTTPEIGSFVALGDSFTEGLGDPYADGTGYQGLGYSAWSWRGWADRFAERVAAGQPGRLRYANLAVRGKLVHHVLEEQVEPAVTMSPDLVSVAAGGNDILRGSDVDELAAQFDPAVAALQAVGCRVLIFTGFDPRAFPLVRLIRGKVAAYNMHLRAVADRHDCYLVDLWSMRVLDDPREWSQDRLHLSPDGHRRVALRACEVMGVSVDEDWRDPLPPRIDEDAMLAKAAKSRAARLSHTTDWLAARRLDARWAREYAVPWFSRRLRGVSSGDGIPPKRPEMLPLSALAAGDAADVTVQ